MHRMNIRTAFTMNSAPLKLKKAVRRRVILAERDPILRSSDRLERVAAVDDGGGGPVVGPRSHALDRSLLSRSSRLRLRSVGNPPRRDAVRRRTRRRPGSRPIARSSRARSPSRPDGRPPTRPAAGRSPHRRPAAGSSPSPLSYWSARPSAGRSSSGLLPTFSPVPSSAGSCSLSLFFSSKLRSCSASLVWWPGACVRSLAAAGRRRPPPPRGPTPTLSSLPFLPSLSPLPPPRSLRSRSIVSCLLLRSPSLRAAQLPSWPASVAAASFVIGHRSSSADAILDEEK